MKIKRVPIEEVQIWEKNPRNIKITDFERLKKQIKELGIYKPLIVCPENGGYTVLGGNMRLRALKELRAKEVDISIVHPKTEAEKIKYALSDNDQAGQYMEQDVAELVYPHIEDINLEDFKLDIKEPVKLKNLLEEYGPDFIPKEKEIDENLETDFKCPKCGYKWNGKPK
jgi:ParB-like chromosome segregation protein Spo0J